MGPISVLQGTDAREEHTASYRRPALAGGGTVESVAQGMQRTYVGGDAESGSSYRQAKSCPNLLQGARAARNAGISTCK